MLFGDFYIIEVYNDPATGMAKELKICGTDGTRPISPFWTTREKVIELIEDGYFVELLPPDCNTITQRTIIKVVEVEGIKYLRFDGTSRAADLFTSPQSPDLSQLA